MVALYYLAYLLQLYFNSIHCSNQFNHQRKVLQNQNVSCDSYSDAYTCDINVGSNYNGMDVQCDSNYPNCNIDVSTAGYYQPNSINCPTNYCELCFIHFGACFLCNGIQINSHNCQNVSITISGGPGSYNMQLAGSFIQAPGNGGALYITSDYIAGFTGNHIASSPGTASIVVKLETPPDSKPPSSTKTQNLINATYVQEYLNYSCIGSAECSDTIIMCGANCNINCSSSASQGCRNMKVFAQNGSAQVNWYCDGSDSRVCTDAQLKCGTVNSDLQWDVVNEWYYSHKPIGCVSDWVEPVVSCTFTSDNICYINKAIMESSRNIQCLDSLDNCQVKLGDAGIDNIWPDLRSTIHCPSQDCGFCVIDCINDNACSSLTIHGYNCSLLEINIRAPNQANATIFAPGDGGDLKILTDGSLRDPTFFQNKVYSSDATKNMIVDFSQCYQYCGGNIFYGTHVTDYLNLSCTGTANCADNTIFCPNDASCHIDCRGVYGVGPWGGRACANVDIYSIEGTHDVNIWCFDGNDTLMTGCESVTLQCLTTDKTGAIVVGSSMYDRDGVSNKSRIGCVDIPTRAPTSSPTDFTQNPSFAPSVSPSFAPSSAPTVPPTQSTQSPSLPPTAAPTYSPTSAPSISDAFLDELEFSISSIASVLVFLSICCGLLYYYRYYKPEKKSLYIRRAMVLLVGIGEYGEYNGQEIDGILDNLDGIDVDIKNMVHLFHHELNYDIFPSEHINSIKNGFSPKQYWKEKELKDFLIDRAQYLENNIEKYDGLVVIISCHGLDRYICTSDYKRISKVAIHRIFSSPHPKIRNIPRLFVFDACSGNNEQETPYYDTSEDEEEKQSQPEIGKHFSLRDVAGEGEGDDQQPWVTGQHNPDYRLALVEAANTGFQAKARSDIGSYVIYSFYTQMIDILSQNKRTFIHKVFDKIQLDLHDLGKQHPQYKWNDNTRYIRFQRRKADKIETNVELTVLVSKAI